MSDRQDQYNHVREASSTPPNDLDWEQENKKLKVRQFMNILEQLPRLCSPTICGTLSQPTTRAERATRGADIFEWSLEQKAVLSPANITTDMDATGDWQNLADLNPSWRQQESETFFSQRTIAPSPMVTPSTRILGNGRSNRSRSIKVQGLVYEEEDEDEHFSPSTDETDNNVDMKDDDDDNNDDDNDDDLISDDNDEYDDGNDQEREDIDDLFFSPQPLKSSQTQQKMDIFSPDTFVRVMEDEHTLQSTPKTTGSSQRIRTRTRIDMLD